MASKRTNNKKKSSKKNKKAASDGRVSRSSCEDVHRWAKTGRVDATGLAKSLSDVADEIRKGNMNPEDVPKVVEDASMAHLFEELQSCLGENLGTDLSKLKISSFTTGEAMGAEPILSDLCRIVCHTDENFVAGFMKDFLRPKGEWGNKKVEDVLRRDGLSVAIDDVTLLSSVQRSYNRTCEKWKASIEQFNRKPLSEACSAYNVPLAEFADICLQLKEKRENYDLASFCRDYAHTDALENSEKVAASARGVKAGWDKIRHKCWECGLVGKVYKCERCNAARYCSAQCQKKSWKAGHKSVCIHLKATYKRFAKNYRRVDEALDLQEQNDPAPMCEGCALKPAGMIDYLLLEAMLFKENFPILPVTWEGATIDQTYKSLADIVRGNSHWMFPDASGGTLQLCLESTTMEQAAQWEMDYMIRGLLFLSVDIASFSPGHHIRRWMKAAKRHLRGISETGQLMPVSRFIGIYHCSGADWLQGYEQQGIRLETIAKCLHMMMGCYHTSIAVNTVWVTEVESRFEAACE